MFKNLQLLVGLLTSPSPPPSTTTTTAQYRTRARAPSLTHAPGPFGVREVRVRAKCQIVFDARNTHAPSSSSSRCTTVDVDVVEMQS
uniref:Putative secreted protein n=1 Tax=Anopheles darlingi TaxID=43151 RepID=A0A2M4DEZ7_ANODA